MPILRRLLLVGLVGLASSALAEDPVMLGFKKAAAGFQSVPAETAAKAIQAANDHLAPHFKPYGANHTAAPLGGTRKWVELQGLSFNHVRFDALSGADRANGVETRLHINVDVDRYRYLESTSMWGPWRNGRPMGVPAVVYVEKHRDRWSARSSVASFLRPIHDGRLHLAAKTPSTPRNVQPATHPGTATKPPSPIHGNPLASGGPAPASSRPAPPPSSNPITRSFLTALLPLFLILGGALVFILLATRRGNRRRTPPRLPRSPSTPPPLPATLDATAPDSLDLFKRRETLMSAAEQKFHAVLEPLVSSHCRIATKVRLADLFDVLYAPGRQGAFNRIRSKHIDFVLTEPGTSRILCGIELDDRSHQQPERIERDAFVNQLFESQNLPLLRVPWAPSYDADRLRQSLAELIGNRLAA